VLLLDVTPLSLGRKLSASDENSIPEYHDPCACMTIFHLPNNQLW